MKNYYIQLFSPHGLIRYHKPEIGRDKDTGGQVKYVLELLTSLSQHPRIKRVDLFTRKIHDKRVSPDYDKEIEDINEKARIVRMPCGGKVYREKEQLWDYLDEFVDKTLQFIEKQDDFPDLVHGHYADGNYIAGEISRIFGIPQVATGHSLGRNKKNILLKEGWSEEKINDKFNMARRISEEEKTLINARVVIVSTQHEINAQYSLYENKDRAHFEVIPPGINGDMFYPFYRLDMPSFSMSLEQEQALYRVNAEIERFLFAPEKPLILSIGRADKRKNFESIIESYGEDKELQAMANLAIFAGVRKDISTMPGDEKEILTNLLLLMDKHDLYGKMALPKKNEPAFEIPEIYRLAARKMGVFVNATLGENFGLTIVEAAACGLPVVASPTGGPKEIVGNAGNGMLVDVEDNKALSAAIKKIIADKALWQNYSEKGIRAGQEDYSWTTHTNKYINIVDELYSKYRQDNDIAFGKKLVKAELVIISDLDGTLVDGPNADGLAELKNWVEDNKAKVIFGLASGRNHLMTAQALREYDLPEPDILICSAGTEIYYTKNFIPDPGWERHINYQWKRHEIQKAMEHFPGVRQQEDDAQWNFKLSYYVGDNFSADDMADLYRYLDEKRLRARVLLTENKYLDILPVRAGKGRAVRYLSAKWKLPIEQFITAGNAGNDIGMLKGKTKGIVVANYSPELEPLRQSRSVYFSKQPTARGVLEGIKYYTTN